MDWRRHAHPRVRTENTGLMLSMHSEETWCDRRSPRCRGYSLKNILDMELVSAIERVAAGQLVIAPQYPHPEALKARETAAQPARSWKFFN